METATQTLTHPELPGVSITIEYISAPMAEEYLGYNADNQRKLNEDVMNKYVEDMDGGFWDFTGAPILFDDAGNLIDGQHRLNAIATSGQAQLTVVMRGLNPSTIAVVDAGKKRSYADFLWMQFEIPNTSTMASLVRAEWNWRHGNYATRGVGRIPAPEYLYAYPTTPQLEAIRLGTQSRLGIDLQATVKFGANARNKFPAFSAVTWGIAWLRLTEFDPYLRDQFFQELIEGTDNKSDEYPPNALRRRLQREAPRALDRPQQLHFMFRTFNAWLNSKPLSILRLATPVRWDTLEMPPVKEAE